MSYITTFDVRRAVLHKSLFRFGWRRIKAKMSKEALSNSGAEALEVGDFEAFHGNAREYGATACVISHEGICHCSTRDRVLKVARPIGSRRRALKRFRL